MNDETKANLAASLSTAVAELSEVARELPDLITANEIERYAEILDHIADGAHEGAAILRAELARHRLRPPLPRRIRSLAANLQRIPPAPGSDAS